jgi:adenylylsulfate kinase
MSRVIVTMCARSDRDATTRGVTLWFTGLSACGKSILADTLAERLEEKGFKVQRLDGDIIRKHLWTELGFSKADRDENIRRVIYLAKLFTNHGVIVVASFISSYRELRESARREIGRFIEVYVKCPIELCMQRDPKGLYEKALKGEITCFTGVSDPYEEPLNPDVLVESDKETVEESVNKLLSKLEDLNYIESGIV